MKLSKSIKPISYLKAHASEMIRDIAENRQTYIITQNGNAKAILQDINSYEQTQESLALLKMLAQSKKNLDEKEYKPLSQSFQDIKKRIAKK